MKITYIISDINKALAFEWVAEALDKERFQLSFILLNPGPSVLEGFLQEKQIPVTTIICRGKRDWPSALLKTVGQLKKEKPDMVHCHLLQANIIGLLAAKIAGIKKRIYTRHHSSLHHVYHKKGVFWDKWSNRLATHVIAISGIVKKILVEWEGLPVKKSILIPHGFRLNEFKEVPEPRVTAVKKQHQFEHRSPVVGVISRFTEWKGVQYIIPAFKKFLSHYPGSVIVFFGAGGDYKKEIMSLLQTVPEKNYRLVPFEKDVAAAYHAMDIFIHTPIDEHSEAFGQIYVEALAAGVPSIFTLSGIAPDFIVDHNNALVVPFKNSEATYQAMLEIMNDESLAGKLKREGFNSVSDTFDLSRMIGQLEVLYTN